MVDGAAVEIEVRIGIGVDVRKGIRVEELLER